MTYIFQCLYSTRLSVSSAEFQTKEVVASGSVQNYGSLDAGFSINFYSDSNFASQVPSTSKFYIGNIMFVSLDWNISALPGFKFFISECSVKIAAEKVKIVQKNCYSKALGTKFLSSDHMVEKQSRFQFVSFMTQQSSQSVSQTSFLECNVQICGPNSTSCQDLLSKTDSDCPISSSYLYTLTGH